MNRSKFKFKVNNQELQGYFWEPQNVKAVIVLIHGLGEHALRFEESVINYLTPENYAVFALDLPGHGKSDGKRGTCPSYRALLEAVDVLVTKAKNKFSKLPSYLYGHSLGGNIAINYVLDYPNKIDKLVAASPYLRLAFEPPKWKISLGKLLYSIWPSLALSSELDVDAISRDPEEVKRYVNDPLIHDKVSPMYLFPVLEAGEKAINNGNIITTPTLLLHGTADRLTDHKATAELARKSETIELQLFTGGYHELHHDVCKAEFIKTVVNWYKA